MELVRRDRPSLWKTVALILRARDEDSPAARALVVIVATLSVLLIMLLALARLGSPLAGGALRFFFMACASTFLTPLVVGLEAHRTRALNFLRVLPQPVATKWLFLLPGCAGGGAIALLSLALLPIPAALALLGCGCWAAAVGHAFAGRRVAMVVLVGWTLSFLPILATFVLYPMLGWNCAAAAALAFGVVGCLAAPRDRLMPLVSGSSHRAAACGTPSVPPSQELFARPGRGRARWTALRVFRLTAAAFPERPRQKVFGFLPMMIGLATFGTIMAWILPVLAMMTMMSLAIIAGSRLALAMSPAVVDFMSTRPVKRGSWMRGAILPWILLAAVVPCTALLRAGTAETMWRSELAQLAYPAATIRAALTPEPGERGARPQESIAVSPALRRLQIAQIGRMSILQLALFAGCAAAGLAERRGRRRDKWIAYGLVMVSMALMIGCWFPTPHRAWGPGPLWLVWLAAASCAWAFVRELRVVQQPSRRTRVDSRPRLPLRDRAR
ncbi:MAG TPA: hypothetical protein VFH68_26035 [Polyangia bacterium]|nr:hypothetical protein [Polyangia bacterium]